MTKAGFIEIGVPDFLFQVAVGTKLEQKVGTGIKVLKIIDLTHVFVQVFQRVGTKLEQGLSLLFLYIYKEKLHSIPCL